MTTSSSVAYSADSDARTAGRRIAEGLMADRPRRPDAVIVFASARYDHVALLRSLQQACEPKALVGCSSAGEFTSGIQGEGAVSALALFSDEIVFTPLLGRGLRSDRAAAARQMAASMQGLTQHRYPHRGALVLADALAGHIDTFIEALTLETGGSYSLFGGGAGDDARFAQTLVFHGTDVYTDAVVGLEMLSAKPIGVGVRHGWQTSSPAMRVTQAQGARLVSLNAMPAVEAFEAHAERTRQRFSINEPLPFFLHNVLGIDAGGRFKLRVPLAIGADGSVDCAADIPTGATLHIMGVSGSSAAEAAGFAIQDALSQLNGHRPSVALFFDCVATRLRMGKEFGLEMEAVQRALGTAPFVGCNTYGQIARVEGQFSGFHNCTATVCVLPE